MGAAPQSRASRQTRPGRPQGDQVHDEYDFGDSWEHDIEVEDVLDGEAGRTCPRCVAGEPACPPEDCGGVWGYAQFLAALADPHHDERDRMLEWVGGEFDPEHLDLAAVVACWPPPACQTPSPP